MKKTRRVFALVAAAALVLSIGGVLAGCNSGSTTDTADTSGDDATATATTTETADETTSSTDTGSTTEHAAVDISKIGTDDYEIKLLMTQGNPNPVAVINAYSEGYFAEEGANVNLTIVEDMATAYTSVSTGDADVVVAMNLALNRIAEGESNLYMVGGIMSSGGVYVGAADSTLDLSKPENFKGLTLCGVQTDSAIIETEATLINAGLERDVDYSVIYTDNYTTIYENALNGTCDVGVMNGLTCYKAIQSGATMLGHVEDIAGEYPCCRMTVNGGMVSEHNVALTEFLIAELRGYELYVNDKEATLDNLVEFTGAERENLEAIYYGTDSYDTAMIITMDPQVDLIKSMYECYKTDGFIDADTPYSPDDYFYNEAYLAALQVLSERDSSNTLWASMQSDYEKYNTTY